MELNIYWTEFAKKQLEEVFEYYKEEASLKVANKLIIGIIQKTINLKTNPEIGAVEEFLSERKEKFRFLVYKDYKVIYWINKSENRVEIADIFDTRQNPIKLKRNK